MAYEINNDRQITIADKTPIPFSDKGLVLSFGSGREAILSLAKTIGTESKQLVFLPAYIPEGLYKPFETLKWTIVLYKVDTNLDPEWTELQRLFFEHKPKLAVLIHYFGLKKDIARFAALASQNDCLVLEDMAHVLPSDHCEAGNTGDFVLFSPTKLFGLLDGGILVSRIGSAGFTEIKPFLDLRRGIYLFQQLGILSINMVCRRLPAGIPTRLARGFCRVFFNSYASLTSYFEHPHPISSFSRFLILHADWNQWAQIRQQYAQRYAEGLNKQIFGRFHGEMIKGGGPYGYPVLVGNRLALKVYLKNKGIAVGILDTHWDFIPPALRLHHQGAVRVLQEHVIFPVSQELRERDICYVITIANEWAESQLA